MWGPIPPLYQIKAVHRNTEWKKPTIFPPPNGRGGRGGWGFPRFPGIPDKYCSCLGRSAKPGYKTKLLEDAIKHLLISLS